MASTQWIVIVGNFSPGYSGGFQAAGPFSDAADAAQWIDKDVPTHEGVLAEVLKVEDPSEIRFPD